MRTHKPRFESLENRRLMTCAADPVWAFGVAADPVELRSDYGSVYEEPLLEVIAVRSFYDYKHYEPQFPGDFARSQDMLTIEYEYDGKGFTFTTDHRFSGLKSDGEHVGNFHQIYDYVMDRFEVGLPR